MATEQTNRQMSDGEVRELAGKVVDWRKTLSPKERAFMDAVIQRAVSAPADVQGFGVGLMPNLLSGGAHSDPSSHHAGAIDTQELEQFQLTFQQISMTFNSGGLTSADSWSQKP
jgi:hypothetical protein